MLYIPLERKRPDTDDRICSSCYKKHLAAIPKPPLPSPPPAPTLVSSVPSTPVTNKPLNGSFWSHPMSERTAKAVTLADGTKVIPVAVHVAKLEELKGAERTATEARLTPLPTVLEEQDIADDLLATLHNGDLSNEDREKILMRVIESYKRKPSVEGARPFIDLTNRQAASLLGASSRTMAAARREGPKFQKRRFVVGDGGYSYDEIVAIVRTACLDPRFCEVRSWVSHNGDCDQRHWEAVAIVPARTMWEELGRDLKDVNWTSLATFYRALSDFYVEKKKERCACGYCKKGRTCITQAVTLLNAVRRLLRSRGQNNEVLDQLRGNLLDLSGHLEREFVLQVVGGRHEEGCTICKHVDSISGTMLTELRGINQSWMLPTNASEWSTAFVGEAFPTTAPERWRAVLRFLVTFLNVSQSIVRISSSKQIESRRTRLIWMSCYHTMTGKCGSLIMRCQDSLWGRTQRLNRIS
jgi:hypothetical protein